MESQTVAEVAQAGNANASKQVKKPSTLAKLLNMRAKKLNMQAKPLKTNLTLI